MQAELMKSKFDRRQCRNYLTHRTYWANFFQISAVAYPRPYPQTVFFWIFEKKPAFFNFHDFLALLDYVSRAHEIEICLSRNYIWT